MDQTKHILLYESCQLTKGAARTLLIDSQRNTMEFLDNEIYAIFASQCKHRNIGQILENFDEEEQEIVSDYFSFLLEKEYAFLCEASELDFFPEISKAWDHPAIITNCIIDLNHIPDEPEAYQRLIHDLDLLDCENLQIRDYSGLPLELIRSLLRFADKTAVFRIELVLKYSTALLEYEQLLNEFPRINELVLHSFPEDLTLKEETSQRLLISRQVLSDASCCGVISPKYFNLDFHHFLESYNYNSCLNRKIAVDVNGLIKNCPSMKGSYGHIRNTRITDVVSKPEFIKAGTLKKDLIEGCSVCEFRHVCTDCRAFLESDLSVKKPAKCTYDPYQMVWS